MHLWLLAWAAVSVAAASVPAESYESPYSAYFEPFNTVLRSSGKGEGLIFVDQDQLDANIALMKAAVQPPSNLRLVTKSLPSFQLIQHIMAGVGTTRLMVFSVTYLQDLLLFFHTTSSAGQMDYLFGIPITAKALERFFASMSTEPVFERSLPQIQFLVDTIERAKLFDALASSYKVKLRISIEVDVGLHRGGTVDPPAMIEILDFIESSPHLDFSGLMGYDGHVPYDPWISIVGDSAFYDALNKSVAMYDSYIATGNAKYPQYFSPAARAAGEVTLNGAGSKTIRQYQNLATHPLNDLAAGSAFTKPKDFDFFTLSGLSPALFMAGPVIKSLGTRNAVPFIDKLWPYMKYLDKNLCQSVFVEGVPVKVAVQDPTVVSDPFYGNSGDSGVNLLPTQALYHMNCTMNLRVNDYVFFRPLEADCMVNFEHLYVLQGPKTEKHIVARWQTYRGGI